MGSDAADAGPAAGEGGARQICRAQISGDSQRAAGIFRDAGVHRARAAREAHAAADTLLIENKETGQRRTVALQEQPVVWAFVESIRSTLAGDLQTLNRFYEVSLEGDASRWRLRLKPTEPRMREVASEIRVSGESNWVGVIEILDAGGDRSVMTITRDAT